MSFLKPRARDFAGVKAAAELSVKCHSVILSALTFEQLAAAEKYALLVVAECANRRLPFTFDFSAAVRHQRRRIAEGLV